MNTASEPRRLRADAARNRQALIDAAQRLFAVRGLSATLDDIAAEAGVNVATAYRHFANKHELAAAFLQQKIDQAVGIAEEAAAAADPWQGLTNFFSRTLELMVANRGLQDVFTPGYADEWFERLDARIEPVIRRLIDRAQQAGVLRVDVAPGDLGVILSMLATVSDVPADDVDMLLRRYLELILAGLRPSETRLSGAAPSPQQARQATMPRGGRGSVAGSQRKPLTRPER
jgi:AcrR family transcriptional regulator